jgi:DNA polymerase
VEWENYALDQRINDRGIGLDQMLVEQAIRCNQESRKRTLSEAQALTGMPNPNSTQQLTAWLTQNGMEASSLDKKAVATLLKDAGGQVAQMLEYRRELAKSSVKKYAVMQTVVCRDGRAHGLIQFYGANRTGRFAGRLVQVQNLPQNHIQDLALARTLILEGRYPDVDMLYGSVSLVLSELIRTAFVPKKGHRFFVADFSAIEARVLSWLAGEQWRLDVFRQGDDIYCASASQMFHVPVEKNGINSHLRQKGKVSELANGYGGSVGALIAMGALEMGVHEDELAPLVRSWRTANPKIVRLWWEVDAAVKKTVRERVSTQTHEVKFEYEGGYLFIQLPSGRRLAYPKPAVSKNRFGGESVTYEGVGASKKWMRLESYGPKFVENITQAIARDILTDAMRRLDSAGYPIVLHVHDEVVIEAPPETSLERICAIMAEQPKWADGLPLRADGFVCDFYKKD